jgi:hypothetical protein
MATGQIDARDLTFLAAWSGVSKIKRNSGAADSAIILHTVTTPGTRTVAERTMIRCGSQFIESKCNT